MAGVVPISAVRPSGRSHNVALQKLKPRTGQRRSTRARTHFVQLNTCVSGITFLVVMGAPKDEETTQNQRL